MLSGIWNLNATYIRSVEEVKKKWSALQSSKKKKVAFNRREMKRTGGGPPPTEISVIEDKISGIITDTSIEQDTVVSLHAMAEFSAFLYVTEGSLSKDIVNVDINAGSQQSLFTVQNSNRLLLQRADLPDATKYVLIRAAGRGSVLVDVVVIYNIRQCTDTPAYSVTTKIVKESFDSITVGVCSRRTKSGNSGMVVQEITLPSGFKADLTSIRNINGLKQKEADLDKVVLYFDSVGSSQICVNMKAERVDKVIQSQTYPVEIYDYYDPRNQGIGNYTSGVLNNLKLCDVCPDCHVCMRNGMTQRMK